MDPIDANIVYTESQKIAVLRFRVDNVRIDWIHLRIESVAAADIDPLVIGDALRDQACAGTTPGKVVLQTPANVIRLLHVEGNFVKLADRNVIHVVPIAAAVVGDGDAAVG